MTARVQLLMLAVALAPLPLSAQDAAPAGAARVAAALGDNAAALLGSAASNDLDRQLRSIRNRSVVMGTKPCTTIEESPANMWFNAEGYTHRLAPTRTATGYRNTSWGATLGADYDVNENLSLGMALTAMFGRETAKGPEPTDSGHVSTYYLSLVSRYGKGPWVNTFVASVGMTDVSFDRPGATGDASGFSLGMLYELAYTIPMDADGDTCWQPVFNVALKHAKVNGYTERGKNAAYIDSQTMDSAALGLGARMQTTIGKTLYNRASALELRSLLKLEVGDRHSCAGAAESASADAFGVEVGAALYIPVGTESGTLFFDASADLFNNAPSMNAAVGYRFSF